MEALKLAGLAFEEGPGLACIQESRDDSGSVNFDLVRCFDPPPLPDCFLQTAKGGACFRDTAFHFSVDVSRN